MAATDADMHELVDQALEDWRQGDCVLGEHWFLFRTDIDRPLTSAAEAAAAEAVDTVEAEVRGLVVLTQTCDLVRSCADRPFVEVSPLVAMSESHLRDVQRGRRPRYAYVPGVVALGLVADLDRVMTVEKSVVASWERVDGCQSDADVRRLSLALARKRARAAFPDDFVAFVRPLENRLISKHDKGSPEGRALKALREIRVQAAPSWDAGDVELTFLFIRHADQREFDGEGWNVHLKGWLALLGSGTRFAFSGRVTTLDDLTAREYVESDPLDLDHLTTRAP